MSHRLPLLAALAASALLAGACGSQTTPTPVAPSSSSSPPTPSAVASSAPTAATSFGPIPSIAPSASASPIPDATVTSDASACSGSHDNRTFFEEIAAQVSWEVYCAVLPSGWYVRTGSFSLRDSGHLDITYTGPGGATLSLEEGNFCTQAGGACAPQDTALGSTAFGDRTGQLVALGGGYAVYVDPGSNPSWKASGNGIDQGTFVTLAASLHLVGSGS